MRTRARLAQPKMRMRARAATPRRGDKDEGEAGQIKTRASARPRAPKPRTRARTAAGDEGGWRERGRPGGLKKCGVAAVVSEILRRKKNTHIYTLERYRPRLGHQPGLKGP